MKKFEGLIIPKFEKKSISYLKLCQILKEEKNNYFPISLQYCNAADCFGQKIKCNDCLFSHMDFFKQWYINLIREDKLKRILK